MYPCFLAGHEFSGLCSGADGKADNAVKPVAKEEAKKEPEKRKRQYKVDQDLLRAFHYFDRTGAGSAQNPHAALCISPLPSSRVIWYLLSELRCS